MSNLPPGPDYDDYLRATQSERERAEALESAEWPDLQGQAFDRAMKKQMRRWGELEKEYAHVPREQRKSIVLMRMRLDNYAEWLSQPDAYREQKRAAQEMLSKAASEIFGYEQR